MAEKEKGAAMTWFFLLVIFGTGGLAYEHKLAMSQAECEGQEHSVRMAWMTGQHQVDGLGTIKGFRAFCTQIPEGINTEQFVSRSIPKTPETHYRPTPSNFAFPLP